MNLCFSDDTSVAIVEKNTSNHPAPSIATIHFLENVTADSREYRGIHPILALESHQNNLAKLVDKAMRYLPVSSSEGKADSRDDRSILVKSDNTRPRRRPDFISATRGPGMRSNLSVGLDTGKALAVAWQIPYVGVHHMQAHLLTPRLVSSLKEREDGGSAQPAMILPNFPFLSILVSGGHSILVKSSSITEHEIMASSTDIAIGESLDKAAREILPAPLLQNAKSTMYGKLLEKFAFPNGPADYADYRPPMTRGEEQIKHETPWGWSITTPFANTRYLQFSFSSIASMVAKIVNRKERSNEAISNDERMALARESMRVCFEHLASRTIIALESLYHPQSDNSQSKHQRQQQRQQQQQQPEVKTLVISGGVAANQFLMTILRSFLDVRGFGHVEIIAPPPSLCTDNAAMIGWAGIEMFEEGWRSDLACRALRKWSLDRRADDGGIFGPDGWLREECPG